MAGEEEWEIADVIGDRAQDWRDLDVVDTVYGADRTPGAPAQTVIVKEGGRRFVVTVRLDN